MLKRFEQIKNNGIFEDFRWDNSIPDFERTNLIYGHNGAGKTSLARALDSLDSESGGFINVSIRMSEADATDDRWSQQTHDVEFERVLVFSEGYVSRSHKFEGDTEIQAVLTLGERTVDDEKRISELDDLIEEHDVAVKKATKAVRAADKALDDEYKTIARGVVTALSRAGGAYRSNASYNKRVVKNHFSGSRTEWTLLSDKGKEAALSTVTSDERESVATKSYSFALRTDFVTEVRTALGLSPVSVVLDTLKEHKEASTWVESGRHFHDGLTTCIFCGGDLTVARKLQIEQHFSDEVEDAQKTTDALIREIEGMQTSLQTLLGDGTISGSLFDDLRSTFVEGYESAKSQVEQLDEWLENVLDVLKTKRANVVARVSASITAPPIVDGSKMERALKDHNERVTKHETLVAEAAQKIELHLLKEAEPKVDELFENAQQAADDETELQNDLDEYRQEKSSLENVEGDPLPSAEVMARELTRILGRSELSFELLSDGKHYSVTRYGKPARDLSTGERTAISLIHFLENVKTASARSGKAIVVVDDPVSSLDNGSAMGISTYIWSEALSKDHVEQLFLLTHNFELFRQWDVQIGGLPGKRGPTNNKGFTSNCYELIAPHREVDGVVKRVPSFVVWPPNEETRVKVRSSYHHAFITAVRAHEELAVDSSMEKKLDALLLYPNVLRRILETFLAFKSPDTVGNFTGAMRDVGSKLEELGYAGDADGLRHHLTRFTHAHSHSESPETNESASSEEIGVIISAVFTFMHAVDPKHFVGLCGVVGVDPDDLLIEAQPVPNS